MYADQPLDVYRNRKKDWSPDPQKGLFGYFGCSGMDGPAKNRIGNVGLRVSIGVRRRWFHALHCRSESLVGYSLFHNH